MINTHFKKILSICLIWTIASSVSANPFCGAILANGISDKYSMLDDRASYQLVKDIHCADAVSENQKGSADGGNIGYAGFTAGLNKSRESAKRDSKWFCKSSYNQYQSKRKFKIVVETINEAIVSAWSDCMKNNRGFVSHAVTLSDNPRKFTYEIMFTPGIEKPFSVTLKTIQIDGASCKKNIKDGITLGSEKAICTRDPNSPVVIVANPDYGGMNLKAISIPKYKAKREVDTKDYNNFRSDLTLIIKDFERAQEKLERNYSNPDFIARMKNLPTVLENLDLDKHFISSISYKPAFGAIVKQDYIDKLKMYLEITSSKDINSKRLFIKKFNTMDNKGPVKAEDTLIHSSKGWKIEHSTTSRY